MFADYHVHSFYSDDSTAPMEDMVKRAVSMGLDEICFTEHVDHGVKAVTNCDYAAYFDGLAAMRARYGGQIAIRAGIEFGVQVHTVPLYEEDFRNWPFDFVIMSCHQVDDKEFWRGDFQRGKTQDEYHSAYYSEIDGCCQRFQNYSVLGHLDVIRRYDPAGEYPDEKTVPLAEPILRRVIADGKGIEIPLHREKHSGPHPFPSSAGTLPGFGRRTAYHWFRRPQPGTSGGPYPGSAGFAGNYGIPLVLHVCRHETRLAHIAAGIGHPPRRIPCSGRDGYAVQNAGSPL